MWQLSDRAELTLKGIYAWLSGSGFNLSRGKHGVPSRSARSSGPLDPVPTVHFVIRDASGNRVSFELRPFFVRSSGGVVTAEFTFMRSLEGLAALLDAQCGTVGSTASG